MEIKISQIGKKFAKVNFIICLIFSFFFLLVSFLVKNEELNFFGYLTKNIFIWSLISNIVIVVFSYLAGWLWELGQKIVSLFILSIAFVYFIWIVVSGLKLLLYSGALWFFFKMFGA